MQGVMLLMTLGGVSNHEGACVKPVGFLIFVIPFEKVVVTQHIVNYRLLFGVVVRGRGGRGQIQKIS